MAERHSGTNTGADVAEEQPRLSAAEAGGKGCCRSGSPGRTGRRLRVQRSQDGWLVTVDVVEDRRIPSSTDILSTYETEIDGDGELLSYRRVRRYCAWPRRRRGRLR